MYDERVLLPPVRELLFGQGLHLRIYLWQALERSLCRGRDYYQLNQQLMNLAHRDLATPPCCVFIEQ